MTVAFIPARCGSKSIKLKNIKSFCGKPLIYWALKAANESEKINQIVVATDCNEIAMTVQSLNFGKVVIYRRSPENALDISSTESVMLEYLNQSTHQEDEYFVLVQATSPLITSQDFDNAFDLLKKKQADSLITCTRIKRFIWDQEGNPLNYDYRHRPRRQDFNGTLFENGAFYINSIKNIMSTKNRLSGKIAVYEMAEYTSIELDEPDDWIIAENLMKKYILRPTNKPIKLFLMDLDGVLTDAGMYYSEHGDELKKFNTHDGKGIELLRNRGVKTGIITSENTKLNENRAKKLKIDYLYQGVKDKLSIAIEICRRECISIDEVAYIGDDINDIELLSNVGVSACPANALSRIKSMPNIIILEKNGGEGAVRELVDILMNT
jgi:N-acylneuraminate cytidylyltransferase